MLRVHNDKHYRPAERYSSRSGGEPAEFNSWKMSWINDNVQFVLRNDTARTEKISVNEFYFITLVSANNDAQRTLALIKWLNDNIFIYSFLFYSFMESVASHLNSL